MSACASPHPIYGHKCILKRGHKGRYHRSFTLVWLVER